MTVEGWPHLRPGERPLAGLLPSILAALGVPGFPNPLGLEPTGRACLLLVDGLGSEQLQDRRDAAPFLSALLPGSSPLTAGFPSTTATSMGSLGTGLPSGTHGLLGYEIALPGEDRLLNLLNWDAAIDPLAWQPRPTLFELATAAGIHVTRIGPGAFDGSGLTRAALRGGRFVPAETAGERIAAALHALRQPDRALVYVYYGDLDATGHRAGVASEAWGLQLGHVDCMVEQLASRLPPDTTLWVASDHGMVDVPFSARMDVAREPDLADGVRLLAGEPRARYVHTRPGATDDVLQTWHARLGPAADVRSRDDAVAAGWFGPDVPTAMLPRIGQVVAAATAPVAVVDSARERPELLRLIGLHGSLTAAEQLVPLLEVRRAG